MGFFKMIFNGGTKSKENILGQHENDIKLRVQCSKIKFYWHISTLIFYSWSVDAFELQWQHGIVAVETIRLQRLKLLSDPFQQKFANL